VRLRGRCPRGERLIGYAPLGHWKTITFVAGCQATSGIAHPYCLNSERYQGPPIGVVLPRAM
jgi:hypothetical protein